MLKQRRLKRSSDLTEKKCAGRASPKQCTLLRLVNLALTIPMTWPDRSWGWCPDGYVIAVIKNKTAALIWGNQSNTRCLHTFFVLENVDGAMIDLPTLIAGSVPAIPNTVMQHLMHSLMSTSSSAIAERPRCWVG